MRALGYITACWAIVMALSPLLQVRRMLVARSAASVSVSYFGLLCIGFGLWLAYGIAKDDLVLVVPNSAACVVGVTTIAVALHFGRSRSAKASTGG